MLVLIENKLNDGTSTIDVGLRLLMKIWGGFSSPALISAVTATHQGHFGVPFFMPAHMGMFGTWVKMFGTFLNCPITTW